MSATRGKLVRPDDQQVGAYQAGRAAHAAGLPATAVPHKKKHEHHAPGMRTLWIRGYCDARRDAGRGPVDVTPGSPTAPPAPAGPASPPASSSTPTAGASAPVAAPPS